MHASVLFEQAFAVECGITIDSTAWVRRAHPAPFFEFDLMQAAAYMRVKPSYLYQNGRLIEHAKVGGRLFYSKAACDAFLADQVVRPPAKKKAA